MHEIRKFASSCSLQQDMLVGDLTEDFNWSSPAVFYKILFYANRGTAETGVSTSMYITTCMHMDIYARTYTCTCIYVCIKTNN